MKSTPGFDAVTRGANHTVVRSMTGFGRAEYELPTGAVQIEIKTVNHRYFDFSARLPHALLPYEEDIRKITQQKVRRGKIHLLVSAPELLVRKNRLFVDEELAREYHRALKRLNQVLGLGEKISLSQIVRMPEVITPGTSSSERDKVWKGIEKALLKALKELDDSRRKEGRALKDDLLSRLRMIQRCVSEIKKRSPRLAELYRERTAKRYASELGSAQAQERLNQEVAGYAKNTDITEEIVRLEHHTDAFRKAMAGGGELGRKTDFIAQEMMREANTIGAKCNDSVISSLVIEVKSELEKIREQAQNLE